MTAITKSPSRLMTIEEFEAMPEDGQKHELLWGELISVSPNFDHMAIVSRLVQELGVYVRIEKLGLAGPEGTFQFSTERPLVLVPDVAFVRTERIPPRTDRSGFIRVIPDLVIDVASPSETTPTLHAKANAYLDQGVSLVVIVHPDREEIRLWLPDRTARVLGPDDTLDFGDVVPGFTLPIATLFED